MSYTDLPQLRGNGYSANNPSSAPAIAYGAAVGTPTAKSFVGRDEAGTLSFTPSAETTGTVATITFATPYTVAPVAALVNASSGAVYATATTTALTITATTALAAGAAKVSYLVVGGA